MRRPKTNDDDDDANASSTHHHREGKERVVVVVDVVVVVVVVADRCAARATRSTARRISSKSVERLVLFSLSFFSLQKNELKEILSGEKTTRNGLLSLFSHWYSITTGSSRALSSRSLSLSLSLSLHEPFPLSPVLIVRRVKFVHARFVQPVRHRDAEYRDDPQRSRGKSKGLFDDFARVAVKLHELVGFDRRRVGSGASSSRHGIAFLSLSLSGAATRAKRRSFTETKRESSKEGKRWVKGGNMFRVYII